MLVNYPTLVTCLLVGTGAVIATPVLIQGFSRRGTGVKYEKSFLIQRAPQLIALLNVCLIVLAFLIGNKAIHISDRSAFIFSLVHGEPHSLTAVLAWLGVIILATGLIFMIGGWYCLGESFSTDSEILADQTVCNTGLYKYVMHPIYSGIIQSLLGASLAATSPICILFTIFISAPLWLQRAKYEEKILVESLGPGYKDYAKSLHWRRLIPIFFPLGI